MTLANTHNAQPRVARQCFGNSNLPRIAILLYGTICYAIFIAVFLYAIGFVGDLPVAKSIDTPGGSTRRAAIISDVALLALFAAQDSVAAQKWFRSACRTLVPEAMKRSTYVLFSSICLIFVFWGWKPVGGTIWQVDQPTGRLVLSFFFWFGWGIVLISTFLTNHFDQVGLRQAWMRFQNRNYVLPAFGRRGLYRFVRHPIYLGFLFGFWFTPLMTAGHLVFSAIATAYMTVAIDLEERDLIEKYGEAYLRYREEVPMLVPSLFRGRGSIS